MKTNMRMSSLVALGSVLLVGWVGLSMAASPPERINLQGVLRDNAGAPVDATQPMTFRLYGTDAGCPGGGTLLLKDDHGSVSVSGGLFNVALGGGMLTAGTASSLAEAFRDNAEVWVEIEVGGDGGMCPRARVESSAYALNADHLDGKDATEFLDTSANPQTKAGDLALNDLSLNGNDLFFGEGARALNTASGLSVFAGESASDDIRLFAGPTIGHGFVEIRGDGALFLRAGNGFISFGQDLGSESAALDPAGNLQIDGALTATSGDFTSDVQIGGGLVFADGSIQTSAVSSLPPDTCFDNVGRFVVCGDGAVKDNLTGLFWLENADCFGTLDWAAANIAAAQLADGQCGLTDGSSPGDWRLPTAGCPSEDPCVLADATGEFASIFAPSCPLPSILDTAGTGCWSEGNPFSAVQSTFYWSSATFASSPFNAWLASLIDGFVFATDKATDVLFVWPVRGGP